MGFHIPKLLKILLSYFKEILSSIKLNLVQLFMLYIDRLTFSIIIVSNVISIYLLLFTFQVKTQSQMAVLFYNTGPSSNQDFVALEIWKGRPRLLVDQVRVCLKNKVNLFKFCRRQEKNTYILVAYYHCSSNRKKKDFP